MTDSATGREASELWKGPRCQTRLRNDPHWGTLISIPCLGRGKREIWPALPPDFSARFGKEGTGPEGENGGSSSRPSQVRGLYEIPEEGKGKGPSCLPVNH